MMNDTSSRLLASSKHLYQPAYVGPSGWIGIELNKGISWKRVRELVYMAYVNSSPAKLVATISAPPSTAAPTVKMKPEEIDRLLAPRARKVLALVRSICAQLPETDEGASMGSVAWRTRKKSFFMLYDHGKGLTAQFWVGIDRQGPLEMDPRFSIPPYMGHCGWMALDLAHGVFESELRDYVIESYRHFATRRALAKLG
jgi:hypothetical protein